MISVFYAQKGSIIATLWVSCGVSLYHQRAGVSKILILQLSLGPGVDQSAVLWCSLVCYKGGWDCAGWQMSAPQSQAGHSGRNVSGMLVVMFLLQILVHNIAI